MPGDAAGDDLVVVGIGGSLNRARDRASGDPDGVVERSGSNGCGVIPRVVLALALDDASRDHRAANTCPSLDAQPVGNCTYRELGGAIDRANRLSGSEDRTR